MHPNALDDGKHLVTITDGAAVTTSLVIAEGTEVQHKNVMSMIGNHLPDFEEFGRVAFETRPFETAGGTQERNVAILNERHATLLMTYMRNSDVVREFKKRLVKAFFALAAAPAPALTGPELMARALLEADSTIKARDEQIATLTPKAEYVDTYVADEDHLKFSTVASSLDMKETDLRELLIDKGWIFCETTTRWSNRKNKLVPVNRYSEYAHKKPYFYRSLTHDVPRFRGEVMHTLKITAPGAQAVARLVRRGEDAPVLEVVS